MDLCLLTREKGCPYCGSENIREELRYCRHITHFGKWETFSEVIDVELNASGDVITEQHFFCDECDRELTEDSYRQTERLDT